MTKSGAKQLAEIGITEERVAKARKLNEIAVKRGQSLAQMAIAWVLRGGKVSSVLVGASNLDQMKENIAALKNLSFTNDELQLIDSILK
jgi:L-glyceraldehyde 3-phosphate reductase